LKIAPPIAINIAKLPELLKRPVIEAKKAPSGGRSRPKEAANVHCCAQMKSLGHPHGRG
jgi:hypothetical protein